MDWKQNILALLHWVETQGPEAVVWVIALQALVVVLVIPGPFFTMVSGFLFGPWWGLAVALCGSTVGSAGAYGLGRLLPRSNGIDTLVQRPWMRPLQYLLRGGGWKAVMSTRLIPFFPFKLSNYFFGWVRFPFRDFLIGTVIGIAPMTAISVTAGSLASDMAGLLKPGAQSGNRWLWSGAGLVIAIGVFSWAGWRGRKKLEMVEQGGEAGRLP
jgi:uncharacterized membrane protein YdjX (TVP38/TMEM64 family)